ncbi:MAG: hypothetical protein R3195_15875 [Gemmatimonadota bacterium]|nr:hypothetical protein [Gemmatimonadota bacterium]
MRDLSMDDGFGLPEIEGEGNDDASGVDVDDVDVSDMAVDGLDVGFDFLENVDHGNASGAKEHAEPAPTTQFSPDDGISEEDVAEFRARWADIQASFIDDPHRACEQADNLVDLVLKRLTERYARERNDLVRTWDRGSEPIDTEDLRVAIKGYRSLIDRLLTAEL